MSTQKIVFKSCALKTPGPEPVKAFDELAEQLALAAPVVPAPSESVRARLLACVRTAQTTARSEPAAAGWFALPVLGVRMKLRSADSDCEVIPMRVEIVPRARLPDHKSTSGDEGIVISGEMPSCGRLLRGDDYGHAGSCAKHTEIISLIGSRRAGVVFGESVEALETGNVGRERPSLSAEASAGET
jgi:hypothetical protein